MTDNENAIRMDDLKKKITEAGSNPSLIIQASLDAIERARGDEVQFVDASNPAVSLFETAAVIASSSIDQHMAALRRVYPSLAQTADELYNHMSYRDYINRFASPSVDTFSIFFPQLQFMNRAIRPQGANYVMVRIPRDTVIRVNDYVSFTLQYPIIIKYYDTQQMEVSYDAEIESPIERLTTNMIQPSLITMPNDQGKWIGFSIPVPQVSVRQVLDNVQQGRYFVTSYDFTDQYYISRAFYRNNPDEDWKEMETTHSPTVYSPTTPTLQLKVIDNSLTVSLPLIYQSSGLVTGEIRIDIYTTKGAEVINLGDYDVTDFSISMRPLNPVRDTDEYTAAAQGISFAVNSTSVMDSGKDALTFEQLRDRVIYNTVGSQEVPITNINIKAAMENRGFELVPNVDLVTNRIFLATRKLPKPSNSRLVTAATIGVSTFISKDPSDIEHEWVKVHDKRATYLSKNLWRVNDGQMTLLSADEVRALQTMEPIGKLRNVNSNQYVYTPFYYVIDTSSLELRVKAFHLDQPQAKLLNFVTQNPTLQLVVNTETYRLQKTDRGYTLQLKTKSGNFYKNLEDNEVYCQLAMPLLNSGIRAYWLGTQVGKTEDGERIFEFNIDTDYDITQDDTIAFTNGKIDTSSVTPVEALLTGKFDIFHLTTSITGLYRPSDIDTRIGAFQIQGPVAGCVQESIVLEFGTPLDSLWMRGRTLPDTEVYERYATDVPMLAEEDIYDNPPFSVDGENVIYHYIARKGDVVRDPVTEEPMYSHRAGDIVYFDGKPVVAHNRISEREFDILTVDGQYYFVDDPTYMSYKTEFTNTIVGWVTEDIPKIQATALEKTKVYFYPKNQLSTTRLLVADYTEETINSSQSFQLDMYVTDTVHRSAEHRERIKNMVITYLDSWIGGLEVSVSDAITAIRDLCGSDLESLTLSPIGGSKNIQYALISKEQSRMSLKRNLDQQQDGTFLVREDVEITFLKASPINLK